MSTATAPYGATLDVSNTPRVPMSRLIKVELRKMTDTKSGMWLMITMGGVAVVASTIFGLAGHDQDRTFYNFMQFSGAPQGFLLPVLGILLVTQEWSQRTGMVTFSLEPHRGRVLWSKVVAALLVGLAAFVIAVAVAFLATTIFGGHDPYRDFGGIDIAKFGFLQVTGILQGLAFGLLLLNSAAAIVLYFVVPTVFSILFNVVPALQDSAPWIDFGTAQGPLQDSGSLTGTEWARLAVTGTIWVILPFLAGLWRVLRAEVK
jgi:ABC-type transport system involved in multi-copper enzyme maturation permease subunit